MALLIGTVVLWLAAISRVIASIRRPDPARIIGTVGAVCIAVAFTLSAAIAGTAFDEILSWPNGAELVQHLFLAVATFATLRFLFLLRLGSLPRRLNVIQTTLCCLVCVAMVILFAAIPLNDQPSSNFAMEYAGTLAAVLYRAVFYCYLVYCLLGITVICRRNLVKTAEQRRLGAGHESAATAVSLSAIAVGAAVATVAAATGLASMILQYITGEDAGFLVVVNAAAIAAAAILIGLGILAPVPVEVLLRWRYARRTCVHLSPLWTGLTSAVPDVVLPVPAMRSPVTRSELASTRRRIEIADALHRVRINRVDAAAIQHSSDPLTALGRTLRNTSAWVVSGSGGVIAADLLNAQRADSELQQIWMVAAAYGTS